MLLIIHSLILIVLYELLVLERNRHHFAGCPSRLIFDFFRSGPFVRHHHRWFILELEDGIDESVKILGGLWHLLQVIQDINLARNWPRRGRAGWSTTAGASRHNLVWTRTVFFSTVCDLWLVKKERNKTCRKKHTSKTNYKHMHIKDIENLHRVSLLEEDWKRPGDPGPPIMLLICWAVE